VGGVGYLRSHASRRLMADSEEIISPSLPIREGGGGEVHHEVLFIVGRERKIKEGVGLLIGHRKFRGVWPEMKPMLSAGKKESKTSSSVCGKDKYVMGGSSRNIKNSCL